MVLYIIMILMIIIMMMTWTINGHEIIVVMKIKRMKRRMVIIT